MELDREQSAPEDDDENEIKPRSLLNASGISVNTSALELNENLRARRS